MTPVEHQDTDTEAREAREAALRARPQGAPLPTPVAWPVDCHQLRQTSLEYYQLALQLYAAGDYFGGDFCISQADMYAMQAMACRHAATIGVAPLLESAPVQSGPAAPDPSPAALQAKLDEVRGRRDPQAPPPPSVPSQALENPACDGWFHISFGEMLVASDLYSHGDTSAGDYHISQAQSAMMMYQSCEALSHTL